MTKGLVRSDAGNFFKRLAVYVVVATQSITITTGIRGQARNPPIVDMPSLASKSMGDIIQQVRAPKRCKEASKDFLARIPADLPPTDDICQFKIGGGRLTVFAYRGRAVGFRYDFGHKKSSDPEEALLQVGINVNGNKPRIRETDPGNLRDYVWSGTFNEKRWKEVRVTRLVKMNQMCSDVVAIISDNKE